MSSGHSHEPSRLPLVPLISATPVGVRAWVLLRADVALMIRRGTQFLDCEQLGDAWSDTGLVFTTVSGLPVEPRNLNRSFVRICNAAGLRVIRVHDLRHYADGRVMCPAVAFPLAGAAGLVLRSA